MNIIVVDDHEENQYMLESLLKGSGHDVLLAANGAEALETIKSGGIDLIISDILMPVMDGFKLCRTVKADEILRSIPFIIYTATYTGPEDETFALKIGADRFILKPCEPEFFLKAVDEVMAEVRRRGSDQIPEPVEEKEVFKLYSERLVRKLEQKMLEAEREIQARQVAEKAVRESRKRLIAAQRVAKMGDFTWDIENGEVTWSDAMFDLLGYEKSEEIDYARVNAEIYHPDDLQYITKWLKECMESGKTKHGPKEYRLVRKDGLIIHVQVFVLIEYENEKPVKIFGTVQDINERKLANDALEKSEERYRVLIENAGEVVMVVQDGKIRFSNRRVFDLLGHAPEELVGRTFADSIHLEDREIIAERHTKGSKGHDLPGIYLFRVVDRVGQTKWVDINTVLIDWEGKPATLNFLEDVTERKLAEEEQEKLRQQLVQAQKLESVGRLAGGVAHDFNNMLSIILGYGEILLSKLHPQDPLWGNVKEIVEAGRRSAALTRQLLAFSRKQTLQPVVLDLNAVVGNLENMLRRLIGEDIEMVLNLSEDIPRVLADPGQIEQVIMNLAVNARDAMPMGGKLLIETANVALDDIYAQNHTGVKPGKYVLLAVTDTGCGMDKEILSQIFDPFFTTKEKGKGTGLGLSTVYGIVKQSNGNVWVYSEPEQGATFKIYLPQAEASQEPKAGEAEDDGWTGDGEHILVVEDEASLRKLIETILLRLHFQVTMAANGGEALLLMEEKGLQPDLVITDMVLPGMSGSVLVDRLRRNRPELKVIYMSGYTDKAIISRGVLDSSTPFIQKPFNVHDISEKVRAVLRGGRQR